MNAALQHGRVSSAIRPPRSRIHLEHSHPSIHELRVTIHESKRLSSQRVALANSARINRNINLIESLVSHSKQTTAPQINRNISRWYPGRLILSIFCRQFFAEAKINRKPELIELLVSRSKERTGPHFNRKLSCPVCPDAGRESAAVWRSNGSRCSSHASTILNLE